MKFDSIKNKTFVPVNMIIETEEELMLLVRMYGATGSDVQRKFHDCSMIYESMREIAYERGLDATDFTYYPPLKIVINS